MFRWTTFVRFLGLAPRIVAGSTTAYVPTKKKARRMEELSPTRRGPLPRCEHGVCRSSCAKCKPQLRCPLHGSGIYRCTKGCRAQNKCPHGTNRTSCAMCKCVHNVRRYLCPSCRSTLNFSPDAKPEESSGEPCAHGHVLDYCLLCGGRRICSHLRLRSVCIICRGRSCRHGVEVAYCEKCGGFALCSHAQEPFKCRKCSTAPRYCQHGKRKETCMFCKPFMYCIHGHRRDRCTECQICRHRVQRISCDVCKIKLTASNFTLPSEKCRSRCPHGRMRSENCPDCKGSQICEHNRRRTNCQQCQGLIRCAHGKRLSTCGLCGSHMFCVHGKIPKLCSICRPREKLRTATLRTAKLRGSVMRVVRALPSGIEKGCHLGR